VLAGRLASETGRLLVEQRFAWQRDGWSWWDIEQSGDRLAHEYLVDQLAKARPDDAVLSEEGHDDGRRHDRNRVWIVDPLDGSADFPAADGSEFAVHVALVDRHVVTAAAVSLPTSRRVFTTAMSPLPGTATGDTPVVIAGRSGRHVGEQIARHIGGRVVVVGSAGVKAMAVVSGAADVYVHPTELWEWDACAPAAVAAAAGLHVSGIDGSVLLFNQPRPVVPGLIICRRDLAARVIDWAT